MGLGDYIFNGGPLGHLHFDLNGGSKRTFLPAATTFTFYQGSSPRNNGSHRHIHYGATLAGVGSQDSGYQAFQNPTGSLISVTRSDSLTIGSQRFSISHQVRHSTDEPPNIVSRAVPFVCSPATIAGSILRFFGR